jgi:pimeloyl-ACP methyl ester carboxylesterase
LVFRYRKALIVAGCVLAVPGALAAYTSVEVRRIEAAHPPHRFVEVEGGRIHFVELGNAGSPIVVLLHGASVNLEDMRLSLGSRLAAQYHVILLDRPGHGWSDRPGGLADASPARQALLLHQALERLGAPRAILVGHSWSGAVATAYALAYPQNTAGLVLLAPVTHPWPETSALPGTIVTALLAKGAQWGASPILGPLYAHTLSLPMGKSLLGWGIRSAFAPQEPPPNYIAQTAAELLLRPREFVANAQDLAMIHFFLTTQALQYGSIKVPTTILTGDADEALSPDVHARALAAAVPNAKLVVLPGVGHMVQFAAPEQVVRAVDEIRDAGRPPVPAAAVKPPPAAPKP